jgi:AraC-like DNA-binding protein
MANLCKACVHPQHELVDRALLEHATSYDTMAERFGLSKTSLQRHQRDHLGARLRRYEVTKLQLDAQTLAQALQDLRERAERALDQAEEAGDLRALFAGIDATARIVERLWRFAPALAEQEARERHTALMHRQQDVAARERQDLAAREREAQDLYGRDEHGVLMQGSWLTQQPKERL